MPKNYIDINSNPHFMKSQFEIHFPDHAINPYVLNQGLIDLIPKDKLDEMAREKFIFNQTNLIRTSSKTDIPSFICLIGKKLKLTEQECIALYAFSACKYYLSRSWFASLKQPLHQSIISLDVKRQKKNLVVNYVQKEKNIGGYTEKGILFNTLYKVKCSGIIDNGMLFTADVNSPETISILPTLLEKQLRTAANIYMNSHKNFNEADLFQLVPLLFNSEISKQFNIQLANQSVQIKKSIYQLINLFYADEKIKASILDNIPEALPSYIASSSNAIQTTPVPPMVSVSNKSRIIEEQDDIVEENHSLDTENSEHTETTATPEQTSTLPRSTTPTLSIASSNDVVILSNFSLNTPAASTTLPNPSSIITPQKFHLSTAQPGTSQERVFIMHLNDLTRIIAQAVLNPVQKQSAIQLQTAINALSAAKITQPLLTEVLRTANIALTAPEDADNLQAAQKLVAQLNRERYYKIALAIAAVITGAAIAVVAFGIALGSVAITGAIGIQVGTDILTKAIATVCGLAGLGLMAGGGMMLFSRPPLQPVLNAVNEITLRAAP